MRICFKDKVSRNNYRAMSIEGGVYYTGYTFFDAYSVIPVFVDALTGDLRLAGLAVTIKLAFYILPQLFMGHFTPRLRNIPLFIALSGFGCRFFYLMVPLALLTNWSPYTKVFILYLALAIGSMGDGLTHVPWLDLAGRTLPGEIRGRLFGLQQFLGGIGGMGAGFLITLLLTEKGGRALSQYALLFFLGAVALMISGGLLFLLKDHTDRRQRQVGNSLFSYLKGLHKYVAANRKYARFLVTQCLFFLSGLASPLYILFAKKEFQLDEGTVSSLIFAQIIGGLAGGILWGQVSHRKGNKTAIQSCVTVNLIIAVLSVLLAVSGGILAVPVLFTVLFGAGLLLGAWVGFTNYLVEVVPEEQRPVYIAITSTVQFPFTLTSFLGGLMANYIGFIGVFSAVAVFMGLTLVASFKLTEEK